MFPGPKKVSGFLTGGAKKLIVALDGGGAAIG